MLASRRGPLPHATGSRKLNSLVADAWITAAAGIAFALTPDFPLDPWGLFNPQHIVKFVFAVSVIQLTGLVLSRGLGPRMGIVITGLVGGLVSSTALTMSLARKSRGLSEDATKIEALAYLGATLAMLIEALLLAVIGSGSPHFQLMLLFAGPITMTLILIVKRFRLSSGERKLPTDDTVRSRLFSLASLTAFVVIILSLCRLVQNTVGSAGVAVFTFVVSLFEMHGSVIANLQLHEAGMIDHRLLGDLLALSMAAAYVSKVGLVGAFGNRELRKNVFRWTTLILLSLAASWLAQRLLFEP